MPSKPNGGNDMVRESDEEGRAFASVVRGFSLRKGRKALRERQHPIVTGRESCSVEIQRRVGLGEWV